MRTLASPQISNQQFNVLEMQHLVLGKATQLTLRSESGPLVSARAAMIASRQAGRPTDQ